MNMFSSALIIALAYYLVHFFNHNLFFQNFMESLLKVSGVPGTAILMLPLGFSIGVFVNCLIHWIGFGLEFRSFSPPVLRTSFEVIGSSIIMGFVTYLGLNFFGPMLNTNTVLGSFSAGIFGRHFRYYCGCFAFASAQEQGTIRGLDDTPQKNLEGNHRRPRCLNGLDNIFGYLLFSFRSGYFML